MPDMCKFARGQSVSEYGLAAALIAMLGLAATVSLGDAVSKQFAGMTSGMKTKPQIAVAVQPTVPAAAQKNPSSSPSSGSQNQAPSSQPAPSTAPSPAASKPGTTLPPPTSKQDQLCTSGSWCVNVPDTKTVDAAFTAGALGASQLSHAMAATFKQIADQLKATPGADSSLVDMITRMSNLGHGIGDMQAGLKSSTSNYNTIVNAQDGMASNMANMKSLQKNLNDYLAKNPGALPPEMKNVINYEVGQIGALVNCFSFSDTGSRAEWEYNPNRSTVTHQSANNICSSGGDSSKCMKQVG